MTSSVLVAIRVPTSPARAFDVFTREIAAWWQPSDLFALTSEGDGALAFTGGEGGRLTATLPDGRCLEIGTILSWQPGMHLAFTWCPPAFDIDQRTEVHVRFEAVGNETRVTVEHHGWAEIPREHVSRHGFPDAATLARAADWWRSELQGLRRHLGG
ncbi:MAG: SRPBCC domain-containing protein [Pseudomonadales bacterium]|nr:SRPBCC domain-containing protein [Pseudomonadales bacterium]MCP5183067.1 SRPBCC domain-containing protein [Pseudomonadales bacterium]